MKACMLLLSSCPFHWGGGSVSRLLFLIFKLSVGIRTGGSLHESFLVSKILEKVVTYLKSAELSAGFMPVVGPHRAGCGIVATDLGRL